jgi:hypothetical protein
LGNAHGLKYAPPATDNALAAFDADIGAIKTPAEFVKWALRDALAQHALSADAPGVAPQVAKYKARTAQMLADFEYDGLAAARRELWVSLVRVAADAKAASAGGFSTLRRFHDVFEVAGWTVQEREAALVIAKADYALCVKCEVADSPGVERCAECQEPVELRRPSKDDLAAAGRIAGVTAWDMTLVDGRSFERRVVRDSVLVLATMTRDQKASVLNSLPRIPAR